LFRLADLASGKTYSPVFRKKKNVLISHAHDHDRKTEDERADPGAKSSASKIA
jgi:hypothetical protein